MLILYKFTLSNTMKGEDELGCKTLDDSQPGGFLFKRFHSERNFKEAHSGSWTQKEEASESKGMGTWRMSSPPWRCMWSEPSA